MKRVESVVSCFKEGFNCSQAIIASYSDLFGLDRKTALRISAGFGGGMGRMGGTCGAVTGSFMVIGLKHGAVSPKDKDAKEKTHRLVREFVERFRARNGSISCKDLLGCDISLPEGEKFAKENNFHKTLCPKFVRDAAEILEDLMDLG
jgi:C_GCAxxG_C_C family probable redox protein